MFFRTVIFLYCIDHILHSNPEFSYQQRKVLEGTLTNYIGGNCSKACVKVKLSLVCTKHLTIGTKRYSSIHD